MRSKSSAISWKWPSSSGNAAARFSMSLVIAGRAGPPSGPENFRPLYSAGLWLAVMLTPPSYLLWMIAWASTGVGVGSGQKTIAHPFFRSTPAAVRANSGEKKRVSCPTTSFGFFFSAETCPAMAAEARRTPPKVKSSAITPRQPEVPKWIVCFVTGDYCILARELKSRKNSASRKSQRGRTDKITDKIIVLVTCGSRKEARKIARALVGQRLAACVSEIGVPMASTYRWKGKIESAKEVLLLIKTSKRRFAAVRDAVLKLHSYDVPEIIALPIAAGSRAYVDWIEASVSAK